MYIFSNAALETAAELVSAAASGLKEQQSSLIRLCRFTETRRHEQLAPEQSKARRLWGTGWCMGRGNGRLS